MDGKELVREALGESMELVGCITVIKGVDRSCIVIEPRLRDPEADATVRAGDCIFMRRYCGCRMFTYRQ